MSVISRGVVVLMVLIGVAVWTQVPDQRLPDLGIGPDRVLATSEACPVVTGRDARSEVMIATDLPGDIDMVVSAGGVELGEFERTIGGSKGGVMVDFSEEFGASTLGLVIDLPAGGGAAAIVTSSDVILAAAGCTPPVPGESAIAGMSTASGESLDLVLANPYTNDAVVEVRTVSEAGVDSASELESVLIPARSVVVVDLAQVLPLRTRLSIEVLPARGVVHAAAVQSSGNERMVVEATAPGEEWLLPIPSTGTPPTITIFPTQGLDTDYTIEAFGGSEPSEPLTGTIAADQHAVVDGSQLPEGTTAVRITTSGASVASVVIESDVLRAGTPGAPAFAEEWLVPGSAGPGGVLRIANPSGLDTGVSIRSLAAGSDEEALVIPSGGSVAVPVQGTGPGYSVVAEGTVFVAWSVSSDAGFGLAVGRPVLTAGE